MIGRLMHLSMSHLHGKGLTVISVILSLKYCYMHRQVLKQHSGIYEVEKAS